jgi:hypothetical protein
VGRKRILLSSRERIKRGSIKPYYTNIQALPPTPNIGPSGKGKVGAFRGGEALFFFSAWDYFSPFIFLWTLLLGGLFSF